jgi:riboflavin kinase/FMN adenylyltransferase
MRILDCSETTGKHFKSSVVTIGNFDGVHRGHAELFRNLKACGLRRGLPTVVVTFEPHPLAVLAPGSAPPLITTLSQKTELIAQAGIDWLAVIRFTSEFSRITAETFVRTILCGSFGMRHILIGHDYAFGKEREGNYATLADLGNDCGFTVEDIEPVGANNVIFSSSLVRRLVSNGDMPGATAILGRYHVISGRVAHGREIGSRIGFPTANIDPDNELIPPDGVYAVMVSTGERLLQGACNIGINPTFGGSLRTIEVFLLDYSGDLYNKRLAVCFVDRLRDVLQFPDTAALTAAINQDVDRTRAILANVDRNLINPLI